MNTVGNWEEIVSHTKTGTSGGVCTSDVVLANAGIHSIRFHTSATVPSKPDYDCDIRTSNGTPDQNACTTQTEAKKVCEWKTSTALWSTGQCVPIASGIRYRKIGGAEDAVINPTLGELHYIPTSRFHHSAATSNGGATPGVINRNGINGGHLLTSEYEKESTATGTSDHKEGAVAVMVFETATPKFADGATNPWMHVTASFTTVGDKNLKNGRQVVSIQSERERASRIWKAL